MELIVLLRIYMEFYHQGIVYNASMRCIHYLTNRKQVNPERLLHSYTAGTVCHCEHCGGVIKPDILFYNEQVSGNILSSFQQEAKAADLLLILGTSLSTYPVSSCLSFFQDCDIVGWRLHIFPMTNLFYSLSYNYIDFNQQDMHQYSK